MKSLKTPEISALTEDKSRWHAWAKNIGYVFLGLIVFVCLMPWIQTVPGEGRIVALDASERRQILSAPVDGRISQWHVNEGTVVKKGDRILELMDNDPLILDRMRKERDSLQKRFDATETARRTAEINVRRQRALFDQGLSSRRQFEVAQMDLSKLESDEAAALAEIARIDVKLSRQEQQTVFAPLDGTVVRILKNSMAGVDYIHAGEPLAMMVPNTESRVVEMWVSGNDMPWVQEGKRVALQFQGWPSILFSGIPGVSVGTFFGEVYLVDALDDGQGRFRILVTPSKEHKWPDPLYLKQGVRANAWVLLNQVPLIYEFWRRFNGFPPSNLPIYQLDPKDKDAAAQPAPKSAKDDEKK